MKNSVEYELFRIINEIRDSRAYKDAKYALKPFHIDNLKDYLKSENLEKAKKKIANLQDTMEMIITLCMFAKRNNITILEGTKRLKLKAYKDHLTLGTLGTEELTQLQDFASLMTIGTQGEVTEDEYWRFVIEKWRNMELLEQVKFLKLELSAQQDIINLRLEHLKSPYK